MASEPILHWDAETRGVVDLLKVGSYRYAVDPLTEILRFSYCFDNGPMKRWVKGQELPGDFLSHIRAGRRTCGLNQSFERHIALFKLGVEIALEQEDCVMSRGLAVGLPGGLDALGSALRCTQTKDKAGYRLMLKLCKPRKIHEDGTVEWWEDPAEHQILGGYCDQDVRAECDIDARLPPLSERERRVWELDQRINDRGVSLDLPAVRNALHAVTEAKRRADRAIWTLTAGAVKRVTETKKIADWINSQGVPCTSIADGAQEELIVGAEVMSAPVVEQVIRLRSASAKAFKYEAMLAAVCPDGRVRGSLSYHSTIQGRWAGRNVQFHNMKRVETEEDAADVEICVEMLHA